MGYKITVDKSKCTGSEECVAICPEEVYVMGDDGKADPKEMDACTGCESCVESCPEGAITVEEE